MASTLRARMVRTGQVAHAQGDVRTAPPGRPGAPAGAPICAPTDTVREAARRMAEKDVSCILVELDGALGRAHRLRPAPQAGGRGPAPTTRRCRQLMVDRAMTVPPDRLAIDAMIDMLDLGIHHLPVVDSRGTPLGIVTATDLMYLEGRTPFAVRRAISKAETADQVVEAAELPAADDRGADPCRRLVGGRLPGAGAGRRHRHHPAAGARLPASRGAALLVGVDGAGQRRPPRADAGLRPGQRASPTTIPAGSEVDAFFARSRARSTTTSSGAASAPTTPTCWRGTASGG